MLTRLSVFACIRIAQTKELQCLSPKIEQRNTVCGVWSAALKLNVIAYFLYVWVLRSLWNTCLFQTVCSSRNRWNDKYVKNINHSTITYALFRDRPDFSMQHSMLSSRVSRVRLSFRVSVRQARDDRVVTKRNSVTPCQRQKDTLSSSDLFKLKVYFLFLLVFVYVCFSFSFHELLIQVNWLALGFKLFLDLMLLWLFLTNSFHFEFFFANK